MSRGKRTTNSKLNLPLMQKTSEFIFLSAGSMQLILCLTKGFYGTADQRFQAPIDNVIHFCLYCLIRMQTVFLLFKSTIRHTLPDNSTLHSSYKLLLNICYATKQGSSPCSGVPSLLP